VETKFKSKPTTSRSRWKMVLCCLNTRCKSLPALSIAEW